MQSQRHAQTVQKIVCHELQTQALKMHEFRDIPFLNIGSEQYCWQLWRIENHIGLHHLVVQQQQFPYGNILKSAPLKGLARCHQYAVPFVGRAHRPYSKSGAGPHLRESRRAAALFSSSAVTILMGRLRRMRN